jgi:hypothetical protein
MRLLPKEGNVMEKLFRLLRIAMVAIGVLLATGCTLDPDATNDARATRSTRYFVLADASFSVDQPQMDHWIKAAETLVLNRLAFGDALVIFPINDRTDEVAPVFDEAFPALTEDSGADETAIARRRFAELKTGARSKLEAAIRTRERALQTKVLAGFKRVSSDPTRDTVVIVLSDAQESTQALDLEKTTLTDKNLVPLAEAGIARERWRRDMLAGVRVQFVLDSPGVNRKPPVNSHAALEQFWRLALTSAGARIVAFDSRVVN